MGRGANTDSFTMHVSKECLRLLTGYSCANGVAERLRRKFVMLRSPVRGLTADAVPRRIDGLEPRH